MASRKKNIKTHPEDEGYVDPQRTDLTGGSTEEPVVIDLKGGTEEVDLNPNAKADDGAPGGGTAQADEGAAQPERQERRPRKQARANGEDDAAYSANVNKRIRRERNLLNRERTLREQTERKLTEERTARQALETRVGQVERQQQSVASNTDVKALEQKIAGLKTALGAAIEAGETAKQLEVQIELGDAQGDLKILKFKLESQQAEATRRAAEGTGRPNQGDDTPRQSPFTDEELANVREWERANRHWLKRPKYAEAQAECRAIDAEIIGDIRSGELDMDLYGEEHLEELSRRLAEEYPDLRLVDPEGQEYLFDDEEDDEVERNDGRGDRRNGGRQTNGRGERVQDRGRGNGNGGRAPQGGIGQGGRRQQSAADLARQGKVQLGQEDFDQMRTFGMDPNNADHKKAFAKERMRTILTEARTGGTR